MFVDNYDSCPKFHISKSPGFQKKYTTAESNGPSPFGGEGGGIAEWNDPMWNKLYGGAEDDDVGDMSQQSSMIGHLLSQVC